MWLQSIYLIIHTTIHLDDKNVLHNLANVFTVIKFNTILYYIALIKALLRHFFLKYYAFYPGNFWNKTTFHCNFSLHLHKTAFVAFSFIRIDKKRIMYTNKCTFITTDALFYVKLRSTSNNQIKINILRLYVLTLKHPTLASGKIENLLFSSISM